MTHPSGSTPTVRPTPDGDPSPGSGHGIPGWLVAVLAVATGLSVANLYYAQPLLSTLAPVFGVGTATAGALVTVTQIGYVLGMLFLVPLGDRFEKRRLVAVLLAVTSVAMAVAGAATGFPMLVLASLVSGATSVVAQILVPFAASLAPDHARGRIVGRVMAGLLTGILLSRTLSSLVADAAGWRVVYLGSAVLMAVLALVLRLVLPAHAPTTDLPYHHVLRSTLRLVRTHPALVRRGLYQAALFGTFSAFWTTVSFLLTGPAFRYPASAVGVFALVGAAGVVVAPAVGRWADRGLGRPLTGAALLLGAVGALVAGLGGHHIVLLALAAILLDVAVQSTLILGQHVVYQLDPGARARLNSVFIATFFAGGALGSQLGTVVYHAQGWWAVSALGTALPVLALLYWTTERRAGHTPAQAADPGVLS
ncbi:MFS transporter [Streptacidiphilus pinicola]|uniref:MFS transporter n=1 Tax=Streptacidiphilus pinicola TaxID=2219663 RepID=A0A2X0KD74_9ACTN|nr:MFS transporter [Streptacidiphilus pinicola]RAG87015.1 MFS transporter [Streptacidiphilus pinicola]